MDEHAKWFRKDVTLEQLQGRGKGFLPGLIGFEVVALKAGLLRTALAIRPDLIAPNGYLHAASIVALADTSCGYGCLAHLPQGASGFTTIELKSNFLGTATEGSLTCLAFPVHLGRNTQVWDATVHFGGESGRRLALFRCTQMVLWPKAST